MSDGDCYHHITMTTPPPKRYGDAEGSLPEDRTSETRLRETTPCKHCQGTGVVECGSPADVAAQVAKFGACLGPFTCEGCSGDGRVVACERCSCPVAASEAEKNYGMCESCRIEAETVDTEREYARIARWQQ